MVEQLLREWPPGYGGVERVAHELASVWGGAVYSLDVQHQALTAKDPLAVAISPPTSSQHKAFRSFACASSLPGLLAFASLPQTSPWSSAIAGCADDVGDGPFDPPSPPGHGPLA